MTTKPSKNNFILFINGIAGYNINTVAQFVGLEPDCLKRRLHRSNYIYKEIINGYTVECKPLQPIELALRKENKITNK